MAPFDRITFDAKIMGGRACIRGIRITVAHVVNMVANGMTIEDIAKEYPDLEWINCSIRAKSGWLGCSSCWPISGKTANLNR